MNDPMVKLPGIPPVKRNYLIAGGVLLALAGIYWVRHRQAAAASADTSTTPAAATDPATGYPTGSPEDIAALQAQAAQSTAASAADGTSGGGGGGGGLSVPPTASGYASNGAWAQAAESYLVSSAGADAQTVAKALGAYIAGSTVTQAQKSVIEQAIAFAGYPPISGQGGYPPSIHAEAPSTTPPPPAVPGAPQNLRVLEKSGSNIELGWNSLGAAAYQYHVYQSGKEVGKVFGTFIGLNGKKPLTSYGPFTVRAANKAGHLGPPSNAITVKTTK